MVLQEYYNDDKHHEYMSIDGYDCIIMDYVKSLKLENSAVLEVGSGFGRYTNCLAQSAKKVLATEPNDFMFGIHQKNFEEVSHVETIQKDLEQLTTAEFSEKIEYIFLFHVLHHLPLKEWENLIEVQKRFNAKLIIVEPNHINPLFFVQIFVTPDMSYQEEQGMFRNNSKRLTKMFGEKDIESNRFYIGWLPRGLNNKLANSFKGLANHKKFRSNVTNPISAYSILEIKPK